MSEISYNDNREIASLLIVNDSKKGKLVYEFRSGNRQCGIQQPDKPQKQQGKGKSTTGLTDRQKQAFEAELARTGVGLDAVKSRYGIDRPQDMSDELYDRVMRALARTKSSDNVA